MECFPHTSAFWLTAYSEKKIDQKHVKSKLANAGWLDVLHDLRWWRVTAKKKRVEHYLPLLFEYVEQISKFMVSIICNKLIIILCTVLRNRLLTHTYILLSSTLSANSGARHTLYSLVSITLRAYLRRWRRIKREWTRLIQTEGSTPLNLFHDWLGTHRILVKFHHINFFMLHK